MNHTFCICGLPYTPCFIVASCSSKDLQQCHIFSPCEHRLFQAFVSGNHSYAAAGFGVLPDVSTTWMWTFATCNNTSGLICCIITIWLLMLISLKKLKD